MMENTKLQLQKAIEVVRNGGIIIFPTDTAFGIGVRIDNHAAVDKLFNLRRRPPTQAMPVLVDSIDMALQYFDSPSHIVRRFIKEYWPGGLTIIAQCKKNLIYSPIRGGGDTVGLRMPNHLVILEIIKGVGMPILGPSANFHGEKTPFEFEDIDKNLIRLVDYVVHGECTVKRVSTVIDCTVKPWRIIREGAVEISNIK